MTGWICGEESPAGGGSRAPGALEETAVAFSGIWEHGYGAICGGIEEVEIRSDLYRGSSLDI